MEALTLTSRWNKALWFLILGIGGIAFFQNLPPAQAQDITLDVEFIGGGSSLDFGRLKNLERDGTPTSDSATRQVRLTITPATGNEDRYIVTQVLHAPLANEKGSPTAPDAILYRVEIEEEVNAGTLRTPTQTPMVAGEEEIYRSGAGGGKTILLITYDLLATPDEEAGAYSGTVVYRVSTI